MAVTRSRMLSPVRTRVDVSEPPCRRYSASTSSMKMIGPAAASRVHMSQSAACGRSVR